MTDHWSLLRPHITETVTSHHFNRDMPDFEARLILDSEHEHFTHLHKFEENVDGRHIFRALQGHMHIVYAVDGKRLVLLRAFKNFKEYKKFLENKRAILDITACC